MGQTGSEELSKAISEHLCPHEEFSTSEIREFSLITGDATKNGLIFYFIIIIYIYI